MKIIEIPKWFQHLFKCVEWRIKTNKKEIFLSFDDGPNIEPTDWILNELEKFNAKATFFCIGENILKNPSQFEKIKNSGHSIGNHTFSHLSGWTNKTSDYIKDFEKCQKLTKSNLFRPPYGRIGYNQFKEIRKTHRIIMWDINSWDFDKKTRKKQLAEKAINKIKGGSIILMHDNNHSYKNLTYFLPKILSYFSKKGYTFSSLK